MLCTNCGKVIRPVMVVDIDGTLGQYHEHFTEFASHYVGKLLRPVYDGSRPFNEWLGLPKEEYRQIKLAYRQGGMKRTMPMYSNASWFMRQLDMMDIEVWIATTRPYLRLDNIDPDTRHWLERWSIPYSGIIYGEDKYRQVTNTVDPGRVLYVLDDLREEGDKASSLGLDVWQPVRPHNQEDRWKKRFETFPAMLSVVRERFELWRDGG